MHRPILAASIQSVLALGLLVHGPVLAQETLIAQPAEPAKKTVEFRQRVAGVQVTCNKSEDRQ